MLSEKKMFLNIVILTKLLQKNVFLSKNVQFWFQLVIIVSRELKIERWNWGIFDRKWPFKIKIGIFKKEILILEAFETLYLSSNILTSLLKVKIILFMQVRHSVDYKLTFSRFRNHLKSISLMILVISISVIFIRIWHIRLSDIFSRDFEPF